MLLSRRSLNSSAQWIQRHIHDTYVKQATDKNYRNRAAFKLIQLDDRLSIFRKNQVVIDLGCSPGGWSQIALERVTGNESLIIGVDKLRIEPLPYPHKFIQGDIMSDKTYDDVNEVLGGRKVNVVLSDMAPSSMGVGIDDHLAITELNLKTAEFMEKVIAMKGWFIMKTFTGPETKSLVQLLKSRFVFVQSHKPDASRKESREMFLVCSKFKGREKMSHEVADNFRFVREGEDRYPAERSSRTPQQPSPPNVQE